MAIGDKPTIIPLWDPSGAASVQVPDGKRAVGFVATERTPAGFLNWLFGVIGFWLAYLDAFETKARTWSAVQTFDAGCLVSPVIPKATGIIKVENSAGQVFTKIAELNLGAISAPSAAVVKVPFTVAMADANFVVVVTDLTPFYDGGSMTNAGAVCVVDQAAGYVTFAAKTAGFNIGTRGFSFAVYR